MSLVPAFDFQSGMVIFDCNHFQSTEKLWGEEIVFCNEESYASKLLRVIPGYRSSSHRHIKKDETLTCLVGSGIVKVMGEIFPMLPGKSVTIPKKRVHSFKSRDGMVLLETSTYDNLVDCDREDLSGKI